MDTDINAAESLLSLNPAHEFATRSSISPTRPSGPEDAPSRSGASSSSETSHNLVSQDSEDEPAGAESPAPDSVPPAPDAATAQPETTTPRRRKRRRSKVDQLMDDYHNIVTFLSGNASQALKNEASHKCWKRRFYLERVRGSLLLSFVLFCFVTISRMMRARGWISIIAKRKRSSFRRAKVTSTYERTIPRVREYIWA